MTSIAPSAVNMLSLLLLSTHVTSAHDDLANCNAYVPMLPPAPLINTLSPDLIFAFRIKCKALIPPVGMVAASAYVIVSTTNLVRWLSGTQIYCAYAPRPIVVGPNTVSPG